LHDIIVLFIFGAVNEMIQW